MVKYIKRMAYSKKDLYPLTQEKEENLKSFFKLMSIERERMDTIVDGIYVIIATLLILEIHVPTLTHINSSHELWNGLVALYPKIVSWVISFVTVMGLWVENHRVFKTFIIIPTQLFWISTTMLMLVGSLPFIAAVMGDYPGNHLAVFLFGFIMALYSSLAALVRFYAYKHPEILAPGFYAISYLKAVPKLIMIGPVFYILATLFIFVSPTITFFIYFFSSFVLPRYYWLTHVRHVVYGDFSRKKKEKKETP